MQLIFLDIDGVLNSVQSLHYYAYLRSKQLGDQLKANIRRNYDHFCPIAATNLRILLRDLPEVKIVISSSWRKFKMDLVEELFKEHDLPYDRVIGQTPSLWTRRGLEIQQWLDDNKTLAPTDFVILDDDSDMEHLKEKHLIQTKMYTGLTYEQVLIIVSRFRNQVVEDMELQWK